MISFVKLLFARKVSGHINLSAIIPSVNKRLETIHGRKHSNGRHNGRTDGRGSLNI